MCSREPESRKDAGIGTNATIVCGHTISGWALIAVGAVVTKDVPDYALMGGVPAKHLVWVCQCGERLSGNLICIKCNRKYMKTENGLKYAKN